MDWSARKYVRPFLVLVGIASILFPLIIPETALALGQLTSRSLTLQAGTGTGGSQPAAVVNHLFGFTVATAANIGSIEFLYCTTAAGSCTTPSGLSTTSAALGSVSGTGTSGFTINHTTNGDPYITRTAASLPVGAVTFQLTGVTNPTAANQSFYVRITTYTSIDITTGATDSGTVGASTATQIVLTGTMPESLIFCVGATVSTTSGVPDCSTATPGTISFNQPFSPADTATAHSQMSASTNAATGYNITVNGPTLTSGSNTVTAMSASTTGIRGTSQFGMNLRANTTATSTPAVGTDVAPAANGTNYKGEALTGYSTVDNFKFHSTDSVADSANGGSGPSDSQIYTVSYMVNVNGAQAVGTYVTTLTYICTATF